MAGRLLGQPCHTLQAHQLGGFQGQVGKVVAEGFGDDFVGLVQVVTGIHQVAGSLHGLGAANGAQNSGYGIRVLKHVFAGIQRLRRQQRLGKGASALQGSGLLGQAVCGGRNHLRGGRGNVPGVQTFHGRLTRRGTLPQQKRSHGVLLVLGDQRGGMAHAGKLHQVGLGATLCHGLRCLR